MIPVVAGHMCRTDKSIPVLMESRLIRIDKLWFLLWLVICAGLNQLAAFVFNTTSKRFPRRSHSTAGGKSERGNRKKKL